MTITHKVTGSRLIFSSGGVLDSRFEKPGIKKANIIERLFSKWLTTKITIEGQQYEVNKKSFQKFLVRTSTKLPERNFPNQKVQKAAFSAFESISAPQGRRDSASFLRGQNLLMHIKAHVIRLNTKESSKVIEYTSTSFSGPNSGFESQKRWEDFYQKEKESVEAKDREAFVANIRQSKIDLLTENAQFEKAFHDFVKTSPKPAFGSNPLKSIENQITLFAFIKGLEEEEKVKITNQLKSISLFNAKVEDAIKNIKESFRLKAKREKLKASLEKLPQIKVNYEEKFFLINSLEQKLGKNKEIIEQIGKTEFSLAPSEIGPVYVENLEEVTENDLQKVKDLKFKDELIQYNELIKKYKECDKKARRLYERLPISLKEEENKLRNLQRAIDDLSVFFDKEAQVSLTYKDFFLEKVHTYSFTDLIEFEQIFKNLQERFKRNTNAPEDQELENLKYELRELKEKRDIISQKSSIALSAALKVKENKYTPKFVKELIKTKKTNTLSEEILNLDRKIKELQEEQRRLIDLGGKSHPSWQQNLEQIAKAQKLKSDYASAGLSEEEQKVELHQVNLSIQEVEKKLEERARVIKASHQKELNNLLEVNTLLASIDSALTEKKHEFNMQAQRHAEKTFVSIDLSKDPKAIVRLFKTFKEESDQKINQLKKDTLIAQKEVEKHHPLLSKTHENLTVLIETDRPKPLLESIDDLERQFNEISNEILKLEENNGKKKASLSKDLNLDLPNLENYFYQVQSAQICYDYYFQWTLTQNEKEARIVIQEAQNALRKLTDEYHEMKLNFEESFSKVLPDVLSIINSNLLLTPPLPNRGQTDLVNRKSVVFSSIATGRHNPIYVKLRLEIRSLEQERFLETLIENHPSIFTEEMEPIISLFCQQEGALSRGFLLTLLNKHPNLKNEHIQVISRLFKETNDDQNPEREFIVALAVKHPDLFIQKTLPIFNLFDKGVLDYDKMISFLRNGKYSLCTKKGLSSEEKAIYELYFILKQGGKKEFESWFKSVFTRYSDLVSDI